MPRMTSYRHGVPSWTDVSSADIERSAAFYCGLFGWEVSPDRGDEFGGYRIFSKDGATVAGLGPVSGGPPAWTTYVDVADADAAAARVVASGGVLAVPPMDLPEGNGRIAFGIDPAGGFFGLFQPGPNHIGAQLVNEEGAVVWHELNVRQPELVRPFYEQVFGWSVSAMEGAPMPYHLVFVDGRVVGGVMTMGDQFPDQVPTHWLPYFVVADAQAAIDQCVALGGGVMAGPFTTAMGPMAVVRDPFDAVFALAAMQQIDDPNDWPDATS